MEVVKNILKVAKDNGYTDSQICKLLKKNTGYVNDWKRGKSKPKADEIVLLAKEFKCSVDYLLGLTKINKINQTILLPNEVKATPHIIGYVDLLGTKAWLDEDQDLFVKNCEKIYYVLKKYIDNSNDTPSKCPTKKENIKLKIFSDNILFAIEYDEKTQNYSLWNMLLTLAIFQYSALFHFDTLVRGGICIGDVYIDDNFVLGEGLVRAYGLENDLAIFPRIVLDSAILEFPYHFPKHQFEQIINTSDDMPFIDYLSVVSQRKDYISNHYKILENLSNKYQNNPNIKNKLEWVKHYHNEHCDNNGIGDYHFKNLEEVIYNFPDKYAKPLTLEQQMTYINKQLQSSHIAADEERMVASAETSAQPDVEDLADTDR